MSKGLRFGLLLLFVAAALSCQTVEYASPQTVVWVEPEGVTTGYYILVEYTVEVIHTFGDKEDDLDHLPIGSGLTIEEALVDLNSHGYQGVFIVSVSADLIRVSDGTSVNAGRAYSDDPLYVDGEEFAIVLEPGMKVRRIKVRK